MIKSPVGFIFLALVLASCATSPDLGMERKLSSIGTIETLSKADRTTEDIRKLLGPPHDVYRKFPGQEVWLYYGNKEESKDQRLALNIDLESKRLVSSTWLPEVDGPLSSQKEVESHFSGKKFHVLPQQRIASHQFSGDMTYVDSTGQTSYLVDSGSGMIWAISLESPSIKGPRPASHSN